MARSTQVTTAAELDAMTPIERRQHFADSVTDPANMSEAELARLMARGHQMVTEYEARKARRAS